MQAVRRRLDGCTVADTARETGLSAPTVSAAWKAFRDGGWAAVPIQRRGRHKGQATQLDAATRQQLWALLHQAPSGDQPGWSSAAVATEIQSKTGRTISQRGIEHAWQQSGLKIAPWLAAARERPRSPQGRWYHQAVKPIWDQLPQASQRWAGGARCITHNGSRTYQLYFHGARGRLWMRCFTRPPVANDYLAALQALAGNTSAGLVFHGAVLDASPAINNWLAGQQHFWLIPAPANLISLNQ